MSDTHVLIWLASDRARLSATERTAIGERSNELMVSAISIWEIRTKSHATLRRGRGETVIDPRAVLSFCRDREITVVSLEPEDCATALLNPINHNDPFDEMIVVHARRVGARLLTRDRDLRHHPLAYHP